MIEPKSMPFPALNEHWVKLTSLIWGHTYFARIQLQVNCSKHEDRGLIPLWKNKIGKQISQTQKKFIKKQNKTGGEKKG
jgi:hypothetical protein